VTADASNPEFVPEWDVFRDKDGNPVTVTWQQVQAIWHAVRVVNAVRAAAGQRSLCAGCGSQQVEAHCPNPQCPWVKCKCGALTGIVEGRPHVSGTPWRPEPGKKKGLGQ
jgi:hypothetical protein